ncbi:MAG: DUF4402 domain-containing protein [Gracilimonas sp.]
MKTLKTLLSAFALVAFFSAGALAQATINANADVVTALTVTADQDLNFGSIIDGNSEQITLADANNSTLGKFDITGVSTGVGIDLTLDGPLVLTGGGDDLPLTLTAGYATSESGTEADGNTWTLTDNDGSTSITSTTASTYYVYVGGTADASGAGSYSGSYTGDVTLTVNYN